MKSAIQVALVIVSIVLAWLIYDSIDSKIEFQKITDKRKAMVVNRLKDIRTAQVAFKDRHGVYAKTFDQLISFVKTDSMQYIKAIGNVPDTLTEIEAVQMGIVIRDTFKIAVRDTLFPSTYPVDSLQYVPYSNNQKFEMDASQIEKNRLFVQVFMAFADNKKILHGLDVSNENVKLHEGLQVGSLEEPTTSGNWE